MLRLFMPVSMKQTNTTPVKCGIIALLTLPYCCLMCKDTAYRTTVCWEMETGKLIRHLWGRENDIYGNGTGYLQTV